MFKVISSAESKESGYWDIASIKTGEIVAHITTFNGFRKSVKQLVVKDKKVCDIKNQDEAIVRLIEFFAENERQIEELRSNHSNLALNLGLVHGHYTYNLILAELKNVEAKIKELEEYSLS